MDPVALGASVVYSSVTDRAILVQRPFVTLETDRVGVGCDNPASPELSVLDDRPEPGETAQYQATSLPNSGVLIGYVGFEIAAPAIPLDVLGFLDCELLLSNPFPLVVIDLGSTTTAGTAAWSLAIPNVPGAIGVPLATQAVVDGPTLPHVMLSNASILRVGS